MLTLPFSLVYEMLVGSYPFACEDESGTENQWEIYRKIVKCEYRIPTSVPSSARSLIRSILRPKHERISLQEIKAHPWLAETIAEMDQSLRRMIKHDRRQREEEQNRLAAGLHQRRSESQTQEGEKKDQQQQQQKKKKHNFLEIMAEESDPEGKESGGEEEEGN